ncbi:FAD-dependent oxidoreductase [Alkalimarinus alittae]|uniref:FAD-dependent oxidoreductase n=1 Tax=Alkalimarinus alittae TaxID=2961619 RepID=A0ABY6N275_9ALTE|nr:FAD-dependent oxidoreductase [Alkalimarinus alittae]UZE96208.1 FAD-dependent oxidoreductase [Alkalimarinus alittae]
MTVVNKSIVIIGAGHAGLTLAREIRANCNTTTITIISREAIRGYYKPNLSKALSMHKAPDQLVMKQTETIAEELNATLLGRFTVIEINSGRKEVKGLLNDSEESSVMTIPYDSLVMATGASPIRLPIERDLTTPLLSINNLEDYETFRSRIEQKKKILIIGAGFVGCELASDLISSGYEVDIIDQCEWPLQRSMPEVMGTEIKKAMAEQGVNWHLGVTLLSVTKNEQGAMLGSLSDGTTIQIDEVVSAVGLIPNTRLARGAGVAVQRGIEVDAFSQTHQPDVYALGDCVEYQGVTLPFIAPATHAAKALAKTLTGTKTALALPALPVAVKIRACPTVVCPPLIKKGIWQVQGAGMNLEAHFINERGQLSGFALIGQCISKKTKLASECIPTLTPIVDINASREAVA